MQRFDIPPGPLGQVLAQFESASGLQILTPEAQLRTLPSPGVTGLHTPEGALKVLLSGTKLTYRFTGENIVTLEIERVSTMVEVVASAPLASPKYTEPPRDLPQTITVIPRSLIEEQAATTLRDVLRNVPGLTMQAGEGGVPAGDNLTLRGFSARNDLFVDGSRDLGPMSRDPFNLEQVEVVKGPQSAFTGRGSAGGSINMVSKSPSLNRYLGANIMFGTDSTRRFAGDVNLPLRGIGLGERTAFRLNMLAHSSGVAGRDAVENRRAGVAPSLAFGLGSPTRLTVSYFKLKQENTPDYGIPWVTATHNVLAAYRDQPAPVPRDSFYGLLSRDFERMNSDMATARVEHDFSDGLSLRNQFRYGRSTRDSVTTSPRFASNDTLVINRNGPSWITEDGIYDNQTDFTARFNTGSVGHSFVGGMVLTREGNLRTGRTVTGTPTTTLYNPNPYEPFNGAYVMNPLVGDVTGKTQALYAFDTLRFGEKVQLNGGLRWERFAVDGVNTAGAPVARVDKMTGTRASVVYKPAQMGSIYASYGTSLNPSLEGLSYSVANPAIEPEKTYTAETGTKWDFLNGRLSLTGALFRVDKTNARTPGVLPDDPPQVLQGRQRVSGVELGTGGNITRSWKIYGAYTFMDSEIVKSNTPAEVGKEIQNAPRNSANLWLTYQYRRFTIGGGPRFVGKRYGNNTNTRSVDSYWTVEGLASYALSEHFDLRVNLYNLTNVYYFDRLGGGHLIPGMARSVMFSSNIRF